MPLSFTVRKTPSNEGIEIDVNDIVQFDIEPVTQEVEVDIEQVPCCRVSFKTVLQGLGIVFSGIVSILSIVFSFLTGRWP